jgi:hypothetical protein
MRNESLGYAYQWNCGSKWPPIVIVELELCYLLVGVGFLSGDLKNPITKNHTRCFQRTCWNPYP